MSQDISWMDNDYYDVPFVSLPKEGGGQATFFDPSATTAEASDVASGKYFLSASGVLTEGSAVAPSGSETVTENGTYDVTALAQMIVSVSGGGGASNLVTGTFNGTDAQKNSAVDININYSGSGYPLVIAVFPSEGPRNSHTGTYYSLVQRYAVQTFIAIKNESDTTPDYYSSNSKNYWTCLRTYKSSSSSADSYQTGSTYGTAWRGDSASSTATGNMRMKTSKKMSVYFAKDGTDNGFAAGIEYRYYIIYSS